MWSIITCSPVIKLKAPPIPYRLASISKPAAMCFSYILPTQEPWRKRISSAKPPANGKKAIFFSASIFQEFLTSAKKNHSLKFFKLPSNAATPCYCILHFNNVAVFLQLFAGRFVYCSACTLFTIELINEATLHFFSRLVVVYKFIWCLQVFWGTNILSLVIIVVSLTCTAYLQAATQPGK